MYFLIYYNNYIRFFKENQIFVEYHLKPYAVCRCF